MQLPARTVADPGAQQNFDRLVKELMTGVLRLAVAGTERKIAFGVDSMTGDATSLKTKDIAHGLGTAPSIVIVQSSDFSFNTGADTIGATTFRAALRHIDNIGWNTTKTFFWVAIT